MSALNGLLVSKVKVNPLIATLGMMSVVRGLVLLLTSGFGIPNLPDAFNAIAQGKLFGIQYPVYIMIVCVVVGDILLRRSRYFRQSYFVGGNEKERPVVGHPRGASADRELHYCGSDGGGGGLLLTGRFGTASVSAGVGVELQVISAVVIGGASLAGGEGTVVGSPVGRHVDGADFKWTQSSRHQCLLADHYHWRCAHYRRRRRLPQPARPILIAQGDDYCN